MSEMLERYAPPADDYRVEINEYFSRSMRAEERIWYEENGYAYTNNLHLWFVDDPDPWLKEGVARNPFDYRRKNFGSVIEEFRDMHHDLWDAVKVATAKRYEETETFSGVEYFRAFNALSQDEQEALINEDNERARQFEVIKNEALDVLAPMLLQAGIRPLDVCK